MKICKTCRYWSMEKKGLCHFENRAAGQFWSCEHWQAAAPGQENGKAKTSESCQICAVRVS